LVFRGHEVPRARQEDLMRLFGRVAPSGTELQFVSNRGGPATLGSAELTFHNDMDYAPEPYTAISLHAVQVEDDKTSTKFADGVLLWDVLPPHLKARLRGARLRHSYVLDYTRRNVSGPLDPRLPQHVFDVPRIHPKTSREFLMVSESGTRECVAWIRRPAKTFCWSYSHSAFSPSTSWNTPGARKTLILWDNLALMHARGPTGEAERTLQKVSSLSRTLTEQFPQFPGGMRDLAKLHESSPDQKASGVA